jgi:hypothetical protein
MASTRLGRVGPTIARWFCDIAATYEDFDVELVDLATFPPPIINEPNPGITGKYEFDYTRKWAASVCGRVRLRLARVQPQLQRGHEERH